MDNYNSTSVRVVALNTHPPGTGIGKIVKNRGFSQSNSSRGKTSVSLILVNEVVLQSSKLKSKKNTSDLPVLPPLPLRAKLFRPLNYFIVNTETNKEFITMDGRLLGMLVSWDKTNFQDFENEYEPRSKHRNN